MELGIDIFVFFNGNFGHMALSVQNNRLNYPTVGCILRTIYGLLSIWWPIINYVDFRLTSKPISIFLNISQSYLAY